MNRNANEIKDEEPQVRRESVWRNGTQNTDTGIKRELPEGENGCEVAVIGGGLTGIVTAYELERQGIHAVVLEADRVGGGQSGNTTAKLTVLHGLKYAHVEKTFGEEGAKQYYSANRRGLEVFRRIVREEGIDCHAKESPFVLYSTEQEHSLGAEYTALCRAGADPVMTAETELPFSVTGAIRLEAQAQFHPLEFLTKLAQRLTVYEHTKVLRVEGNRVETTRGTIKAKAVVFACHFPFVNIPGYYFARMHQSRSYVTAWSGDWRMEGMYFSADKNGFAFRTADSPDGKLLLVSGEGHRTGDNQTGGRYRALEKQVREWYPKASLYAAWSAQDCMPLDCVPYIGAFSPAEPCWYVATGYGKWGMTSSFAAALILTETILHSGICEEKPAVESKAAKDGKNAKKEPPQDAAVFDPKRFTLRSADDLLMEGGRTVCGLAKAWVLPASDALSELQPGHGGIVEWDGHKIGAYRDETGKVYAVDPRCPHLGCQLAWNPDERSWDCPCHGSRFSYLGELLDGPAQTELEQIPNSRPAQV